MNFDRSSRASCVIPTVPPADPNCLDAAYALAHPEICSKQGALIIKPGVLILCVGDSIRFQVYEYLNGVETLLGEEIRFTSSNVEVFQIGVLSGSGTCLEAGTVRITGTHTDGRTVSAEIEVNPEDGCCDEVVVATGIVVDNSRSMTLAFGAGYATRLDYAKHVAGVYSGLLGLTAPPSGGSGGGGGSGSSSQEIYYYVSNPNDESIVPEDPDLPAIAYQQNGAGPVYGWNVDLQLWN